jgi:pilus assembly protein CpaE
MMRGLVVSHTGLEPISSRLREGMRPHLEHPGAAVASFGNLERMLLQVQPQVVAVALAPQPERGLEALRQLRRLFSGHILAVGQVVDPKLILKALQEGADHFLDEGDIDSGLPAILGRWQDRKEALGPLAPLMAVLASCGGCGASTLAVNLAAAVARDFGTCGLIDLKPGRGDLASLLDLRPSFSLADLCQNAVRLDRAMFEKSVIEHASGVHLLGSAQSFKATRAIHAQAVDQILALARRTYPQVVVDLEDCFHEEQVLALRQAKDIVLVCRLDFTALRNARRILDHLRELDIPHAVVRCVVNRRGQPGELPVNEAEDALGNKLTYFLPDDAKTINQANNLGIPAVIRYPSAKVSQQMVKLARDWCERRHNGAPLAAVGKN